jgi:hypothetical protein
VPVEQNPPDVERNRQRNQTRAKRNKEDDRFAPTTKSHAGIVERQQVKVKRQAARIREFYLSPAPLALLIRCFA